MNALTIDIEARIAGDSPDIEVLLVEVVEGDTLRVFIDHPNGVTLAAVRSSVTQLLNEYREQYAIEVSSPGEDRPLTKPQHFRLLPRAARQAAPARGTRRAQEPCHGRAGRRLRGGGHDRCR